MNCRVILALCIALVASNTFARMVPRKDPLDGVLDAQLVVIVRQWPVENTKVFKIEDVFLGDKKKGDDIDLGELKLETIQESGPPMVEPITPETRILVFLQHSKESPRRWEPTYYQESVFWVQRSQDVLLLRRAAERAVDLRQRWERAAKLSDLKQRVYALWPFLSLENYGVSFSKHTQAELRKAKPVAGEYFAAHFDEMSHDERMLLLPAAGGYGSEKLQVKLRTHLYQLRQEYEHFVARSGTLPKNVDWNTMPEDVKDATGELYYGLGALASFDDRDDLSYIRAAGLWSAKYHLEQMADAAVDAFRDMPDVANLPVMDSLLKEFLPGRRTGMWSVDWDAERALCKHSYPETIPLLALFLGNGSMADEAHECLTRIVGRDFGPNPKAWIDWYKTTQRQAPGS